MEREEAIEIVKNTIPYNSSSPRVREALETLIPEFKVSDEEQTRKWILEYLYDGLRKSDGQFKNQFKNAIDWLDALKPQSNWKPTKEQMQTLHAQLIEGAVTYPEDKRVLTTLYEDLMKIFVEN